MSLPDCLHSSKLVHQLCLASLCSLDQTKTSSASSRLSKNQLWLGTSRFRFALWNVLLAIEPLWNVLWRETEIVERMKLNLVFTNYFETTK